MMAHPQTNGIRAFVPRTDLAQLADLIDAAFGDELRRTGNRLTDEMRQLATWGSLLGLAASSWPLYHGCVWVEDKRIIGNVSYSREHGHDEWQISNVAVYPEHRGRGIAGRLLDCALEDIRRMGGQRAYLQVNVDNVVARRLYLQRGFRLFDTIVELGLWPRPGTIIPEASRRVEPVAWWQSRRMVELARQALPPSKLQARPHILEQYRPSLWARLSHALLLDPLDGRCDCAVIESGALVAIGRLWSSSARGPLELELLVHPLQRGQWEVELTRALLGQQVGRARQIRAHVTTAHPEATEALRMHDFEQLRTLDEMVLTI